MSHADSWWAFRSVRLGRRLAAEFVGSLLLAAVVVGSGIAAQQLSPTDVGLQLTQNAGATALGLFAIILIFGTVSGAHFNPVVSLVDAASGGLRWRTAASYLPPCDLPVGTCTIAASWPTLDPSGPHGQSPSQAQLLLAEVRVGGGGVATGTG